MLTLDQLKDIAKNENVIFYKLGCPFCKAAEELCKELIEEGVIEEYSVYHLGEDFTNQDLTDLVKEFGWKADGYQEVCTKPQIFMEGQYVGGNREFYLSKWNLGDDQTGKIKVGDEEIEALNIPNPMRF
jgi:glutaredoxin